MIIGTTIKNKIEGTIINMNKTKTLFAGPWCGEFGWELFCWQGYLRKLSKNFGKVIVASRTGHEFLYEDFADEFYPYDTPASEANMWYGELDGHRRHEFLKQFEFNKYVEPFNIGYGMSNGEAIIFGDKFYNQEYIKYSANTIDEHYDLIVHPRNKIIGAERNWDKDNWQKLVDGLLKEGYSVAEIGTEEAFELDGVKDYRNISIRDTVSLINRTKLVAGQSSGPLHLASLAGTPHLVWSDIGNEPRYKKDWNPHGTEVIFCSKRGWNPTVNDIKNVIIKRLEK